MLAGKLAIVTGASSGIGLATARMLASEGAKVFVTGRNEEKLRAIAAELGAGGGGYLAADLTHPGACKRAVDAAVASLGGLTTLVNCAGVLRGGAFGTEACNLDNFLFNITSNTQTVFEMMEHATPHLKTAGLERGAAILNISSVNGKQSFGGCASYCASKVRALSTSKLVSVPGPCDDPTSLSSPIVGRCGPADTMCCS